MFTLLISYEPLIMKIFADYEISPGIKNKRTMNFLFCGHRYYKKTDI